MGGPAGRRRSTTSTSSPTATTTPRRSRRSTRSPGRSRCCRGGRSGNWWSRYFPYTAEEYLALMDRFDEEGVPFSVAVLDMDWHPVEGVDPAYGSGWTGYSWNRDLFPDPEGFLGALHERGMRSTLNLHPADGVRAFEDAYEEMAAALRPRHQRRGADHLRHHRPGVRRGLPRDRCTGGWRTRASTSGGSTGSPGRTRGCPASTRCGCSTTSTSWTPAATVGGRWCSRGTPGPAATATRSASRATPSSRGSRWPSSRSSPRPRRTSATAGGATTSVATSAASATTSSRPAGCSTASSRRSCGCTRRTTRSWSRSRGRSAPRRGR